MDKSIKIRLVTDKERLNEKGHDVPVVELYNEIIDTWISIKELSFYTLEREINHMQKVTEWDIQERERIEKTEIDLINIV